MARNTVIHQPREPALPANRPSDGARWLIAGIPVAAFFVVLPMVVSNPDTPQIIVIAICIAVGILAGIWAWKWEALNARYATLRTISGIWVPRVIRLALPTIAVAVILLGANLVERVGWIGETKESLHREIATLELKRQHLQGETDFRRLVIQGRDGLGGLRAQLRKKDAEIQALREVLSTLPPAQATVAHNALCGHFDINGLTGTAGISGLLLPDCTDLKAIMPDLTPND